MLNGIFQRSTSHDTMFNICGTAAATFVAQQMLNRASFDWHTVIGTQKHINSSKPREALVSTALSVKSRISIVYFFLGL